jgi:multidrug efflux pump subunit AcrA (membrane-fusion protein)
MISIRRLSAAAGMLAVLLAACGSPQVAPTPTPISRAPTPIPPPFRVEMGPVEKTIQFNARVQPRDSAALYFENDGRVLNVSFREGDEVKAGDVLAELDVTDLRNEVEQRLVELRTAESVLSNTVQGFTRTLTLAQLDVDQAQLRMQMVQQQADGTAIRLAQNDLDRNARRIADIEASIKKAREEFNQAGADNAARELTDAQIERERLQAVYDRAVAEQKVKQLEVQMIQKDLQRAQLNLQNVQGNVDPSLLSNVERARIAYEGAVKKLSRSELKAPIDGIIALQTIRAGSNVRALDPVITVAKPGELQLVGTLTSVQMASVDIAQRVSCFFENDPNTIHNGFVREFPKMPPGVANLQAFIQLEGNVQLEVSRLARCLTTLGKRDNVMWLPPAAVRNFQGRRFVIIQEADGRQRRTDVEIGLEATDRVEIKSGVNVGDVVIAP